jgi:GNAT superfamily N-acetyltransferase
MLFREAILNDIPQIQEVRHSVKENRLSDPGLVTDRDCAVYISKKGKGWVCLSQHVIVGFAVADLTDHNIWALFVRPDFEKQGIGRGLHGLMMDWYFSQTRQTVWLGTAPGTRADFFYRRAGWKEIGIHGKGEIKFEMTYEKWISIR